MMAPGLQLAEPKLPPLVGLCGLQLAQVFLCKGCCCGQTERKRPPVPVDELKAIWKDEKLNRSVQLTISGCLGPCQMANVVMLMTPDQTAWFGLLSGGADYAAVVDWARACHAGRRLAPIPAQLQNLALARFNPECA